MKGEEFASSRHFMLISSHIHARLSLNCAEYPRNLEGTFIPYTFAPRNVEH